MRDEGPWRAIGATGRTFGARASLAQERERVVAGVVAVAPGRREGVVPDEVDVDQLDLLWRERGRCIEPTRKAGLAAAERARAKPAQVERAKGRLVPVRPLELEGARASIRVDLRRRRAILREIGRIHRHGARRVR